MEDETGQTGEEGRRRDGILAGKSGGKERSTRQRIREEY